MLFPGIISIGFWIMGGILFYVGSEELRYNYILDLRRKKLETAIRINAFRKYFVREGLITETENDELIKDTKRLIKKGKKEKLV